jgi:hypothetical protein
MVPGRLLLVLVGLTLPLLLVRLLLLRRLLVQLLALVLVLVLSLLALFLQVVLFPSTPMVLWVMLMTLLTLRLPKRLQRAIRPD